MYNYDMELIGTVPFKDNLTLSHAPDYVNMNGYMGIRRLCNDEIVLMYYDKHYPSRSYAERIDEEEAYRVCLRRGRLDVAKELGLELELMEREVI